MRRAQKWPLWAAVVRTNSLPTYACYAANSQQTHVLRSQPHRIVSARGDALQEHQTTATTQVLRDAIPRIVPEDQHGARERAPARRLRGRRPYACGVLITSRRWRRGRPHSRGSVSRDVASAAGFQKQTDATGREYLVDKLTGAWTPVAELTNNAPVSPLRDGEDAAMYQRPSACHPSATTSAKKRGRDEMGPFRTGKPADDDTSIVSSENSQKSLHDEVAQLRARLDAVERRTAADLLAMETVISWLKDNHDRTQQSLESLARGVTP